ncbi:hypothetical protein HYDPIDRAFT_28473 [Hydnomerulius pinastri MD-312]|uniref:F-box domain-containing protein n=1 Tax=Hydnomerulius pinastri MD-312 TaxID=994086 RepID=A0A0C9VG22_9AGAM|nr:hypothetical protein HYDPIDRAFT_28473 [Hydnomerulius pinastri MD-312]
MSLLTLNLNPDCLLAVLWFLDVGDVLRLRLTCRALCQFTKERDVWAQTLRAMLQGDFAPLPVMHGSVTLLSSEQLESIARRAARLESDWYGDTVAPRSFKQLRIGRSVTWLRLVHARWLIVASSDTQTSALSCWDLAVLTEELTLNNPTAECFLTGPVRSGELRLTSDGGIILAIGVDSR